MFRIKLLWVGKTKETFLQEGIQQYQKKLRPYLRLSIDEVPASQHLKSGKMDSIREETQKILQKVDSVEQTIFLDEKGKGLSSEEFASFSGETNELRNFLNDLRDWWSLWISAGPPPGFCKKNPTF